LCPPFLTDPNALLDACIAFYPEHFSECPSFAAVAGRLGGVTCLDFDLGHKDIPTEWEHLRGEARHAFAKLVIFAGALQHHSPRRE
jgi:hypothetical protein